MRADVTGRDRRLRQLRRQLDSFDPGRWLAHIRAQLVAADGRLTAATARRLQSADARLRGCANRLDTLSPLAVLGRGYAVCWTGDGTRIVRAALDVEVGETVRVTLAKGELDCEVRGMNKSPTTDTEGN